MRSAFYLALLVSTLGAGPAPEARPETRPQGDSVELIFLNVGQGDAVVIRAPGDRVALIDAGPDASVLDRLRELGIERIDLAVASHPHADHIGGMAAVIRSLPVRYYLDNGTPHTTATYLELMRTLRDSEVTYLEPRARTLRLGELRLHVLPPPVQASGHNNRSVGLLVEYGAFRALLTGDSQTEELDHFLSLGVPEVSVLKAAHHGSSNGVTPAWLTATDPAVVVISCGEANPYGHPHADALRRYAMVAERVLRTDRDGRIRVSGFAGGEHAITTAGTRERLAAGRRRESGGPAGRPTGGSDLSITVIADAPGNDHRNPNGEYVIISNTGAEALTLGGWSLCDAAGHCYTFPASALLSSGDRARVYTGTGRSGEGSYYMNRHRAVWNNRGDVATLRDASGRIVVRHAY